MARRTKWLTAALVVWISFWGAVFFMSREAFRNADRGFWAEKLEGNEATARMYHDAQVQALEWGNFSIWMGLVVPLGLFVGGALWRRFRSSVREP